MEAWGSWLGGGMSDWRIRKEEEKEGGHDEIGIETNVWEGGNEGVAFVLNGIWWIKGMGRLIGRWNEW